MADPVSILIDNLKETFKTIEKFLVIGLTASLVLILLAITDREFKGVQNLAFVNATAPATLVATVTLATYFAAGAFAAFYFMGRRTLVRKLRQLDPQILDALLMYPSVVARMGALQIIALLGVCGSGLLAFYLLYRPTNEIQKSLIAFAVIGSPYIVLFGTAVLASLEELTVERKSH